jgi:UDP-N-acetyl-D-glucosamine dehydrogenase
MPKYVAKRALALVDTSISKPRVLILGVAYKAGVGDVRETPASELRDHLVALGAEVAWHDPLVLQWQNSNPVDLDWECDVAILATKQPGMEIYAEQVASRRVPVLDCTNSIKNFVGVIPL